MKEIIGKDLSGWRIETWYEVRLSVDECGANYYVAGYFTDKDLACASCKGRAAFGGDGMVAEVSVLTSDGVSGYIIKASKIRLSNPDSARAEAIENAKAKLSLEERKLLGIE